MTADESLFLQPNKDEAGEPTANFCLVVMKVDEVRGGLAGEGFHAR